MDYFNATVYDGNFVSKRRGMRVSKTQHKGMRFVNTFAAGDAPASPSSAWRVKPQEPSSISLTKRLSTPTTKPPTFTVADSPTSSYDSPDDSRELMFQVMTATPDTRASSRPLRVSPKARNQQRARDLKAAEHVRRCSVASVNSAGTTPPDGLTAAATSNSHSSEDVNVPKEEQSAEDALVPRRRSPKQLTSGQEAAAMMVAAPITETYQLKHWKTHPYLHECKYNGNGHRFIHQYLSYSTRYLYPQDELLKFNPVHSTSFFRRLNVDAVTMEYIVMISALVKHVLGGSADWNTLGPSITKVCRMVTARLSEGRVAGELAVLESISAMAFAGMFMAHYDHWYFHMKGLCSVIARSGGLSPEWGHVLDKVRKCDIKGAASACCLPQIEFVRFFPPVSDLLPTKTRVEISLSIQQTVVPCGITPVIAQSIQDLALFTNTIKMGRTANFRSLLFDPYSLGEEYLWVQDQLVRYPGALRDGSIIERSGMPPVWTLGDDKTQSASLCLTAPAISQTPPIPAPAANMLDPVVRIAGILYIEEIFQELRSMAPYAIPISLLNYQLRLIVGRVQARLDASTFSEQISTTSPLSIEDDDLASIEHLRPVLIWVCTVAYAIANILDKERWTPLWKMVDRTAYQDCIAVLLSSGSGTVPSAAEVDTLPESDFALCEVLPVSQLASVRSDEKTLLKEIVRDYRQRLAMETMPLFL